MLQILGSRTYRHLFLAQVMALLGTGLATVALGLLAHDLAGEDAGVVLGTAPAFKIIAYVGVAPVASAFAEQLPRRRVLVCLDLVRAEVAVSLPFVTEVWLADIRAPVGVRRIHADRSGDDPRRSAGEAEYTRALSLSRLAYDLESPTARPWRRRC